MAETELLQLRAEIDAIDAEILALLEDRMDVVTRVAAWKARTSAGMCPIRSGREAAQLRRVTSASGAFSRAAMAHVWRHVINASLAIEGALSVAHVGADPASAIASAEYFGSYTPHVPCAHAAAVVESVAAGNQAIGVVPLADVQWWPALAKTESLRVFAALPLLMAQEDALPHAVAFARLHPEPSGDDVTLAHIRGAFEYPLPHRVLAAKGEEALVAIDGFVTQEALPAQARLLGAYATPLLSVRRS